MSRKLIWAGLLAFIVCLFGPAGKSALAQPCQWNYSFQNNVATATYCGQVVTQGGIVIPNVNTVTTIAQLQALTSVQASSGSVWSVLGYRTTNDGGGGQFVLATGACNNAGSGDGGTQFPSTIAGTCWTRLGIINTASIYWFGAYGDNIHDDTVAIQNWTNASAAMNVTAYCPIGNYKITSTITMAPGVRYVGALGFTNFTQPACIFIPSGFTTAWVFDLENANGAGLVAAPTFENISVNGGQNIIRYNNPANGFTNDGTTQAPMDRPIIRNVYISQSGAATGIAIQCSKCFQGTIDNNTIIGGGGATGIDLEGSDHFVVSHNYIGGFHIQGILAVGHNTFGSNLVVNNNNRFLQPSTGATAYIVDQYYSSWIDNNFFEGSNTVPCLVSISQGFQFEMGNNDISGPGSAATNTLCVTDTANFNSGSGYLSIDFHGNTASTTLTGPTNATPNFNSGAGTIAYFANNSGGRRLIRHYNNLSNWGDAGWPMNSQANTQTDWNLQPITAAMWSCNTDGLSTTSFGATVNCSSAGFKMTSTGSGNFLSFGNTFAGARTGTMDLWVLGQSASGGNINGCITDAGSCLAAYAPVALSAQPRWVKVVTGGVVATSGGANIYASTSDIFVSAVALTYQGSL